MKFLIILVLTFAHAKASAWSNRPELGLGFTNNANYEDSDKDSDFYFWIRNFLTNDFGKHSASFWLSYKDHVEESQYDAINWRAGFGSPANLRSFKSWFLDLGMGGQHYTSSNPGTTEEGFDFVYGEGSFIQTKKLKSNIEMTLEPGYQLKVFTDLFDRIDHRIFFNGLFDIKLDTRNNLTPYGEFGLVFSNESLFRKNYLEFGLDWVHLLRRDLKVGAGLMLRTSSYVNRTITSETPISRKRGRSRSGSESQNEVQHYSQLQTYIAKMYKSFELKGSLDATSQNSKSGFEDYAEYGVKISVKTSF